jgi:hypothetical protein
MVRMRLVRDDIAAWLQALVEDLGIAGAPGRGPER